MKRLLAAAVLVCLAGTGCAGGASKAAIGEVSSSPTPSARAAGTPTTSESAGATASAAECQKIAEAFTSVSGAFRGTRSTPFAKQYRVLAAFYLKAAADVDKPDVSAALRKLAAIYGEVATRLTRVDYQPSSGKAPPAAYEAAFTPFKQPGFERAGATVGAYLAGSCY